MKLVKVTEIFDVQYGTSLELNRLTLSSKGINFVSRTSKNNGISAKVEQIHNVQPSPAGIVTVSLGGSVLETFLQPEPFYTGYHIYCLKAKIKLTDNEKLFYCACISANKFRYNYGRQANRTLRDLLIPDSKEIPEWVHKINFKQFETGNLSFLKTPTPRLDIQNWKKFKLDDLFELKKGKRLTKANISKGNVPFIGAIDSNNGYRQLINRNAIHFGNTITVNYNGSVAESFYQPNPFWASDDVNVLYPKFEMNQYIGLFIVSLLKIEKYRFNYGRKWHIERMKATEIKLPTNEYQEPDFKFMEKFIKTLNFSKEI